MQVDELVPLRRPHGGGDERDPHRLGGESYGRQPHLPGHSGEVPRARPPGRLPSWCPSPPPESGAGLSSPARAPASWGPGSSSWGRALSASAPRVESYSSGGQRVLLLGKTQEPFGDKSIAGEVECLGLVLLSDKIRREPPGPCGTFADQGVDLKVISGDNAVTVANIAKKAGAGPRRPVRGRLHPGDGGGRGAGR